MATFVKMHKMKGHIFTFGQVYTIRDLNLPSRKLNQDFRDKVKIVFIDDEKFVYYDELIRSGFHITHYEDVPDLQTLGEFGVIICDIKGVGKAFNSPSEGAYLIRELKKRYPYKIFAAYTGSTYDISLNSYLESVHIIKKDIEIDDWCTEIDLLIKKSVDPRIIWETIRNTLIKEEVPTLMIAKLENDYVDILINKGGNFREFPSEKTLKVSSDVRSIIQSLVANVIFSIIA